MSNEVTIDDVSNFDRRCEPSWTTYHALHSSLQFPALRLKHVRIKDEVALLKTINTILQGGTNNLQVCSVVWFFFFNYFFDELYTFVSLIYNYVYRWLQIST